ncbi:MAG: thioredoxin family protein [Bacteroidota bacterium]
MKNINWILFFALLMVAAPSGGSLLAQSEHLSGPVKWMSIEEAVERSKKEKRLIFIDVYTDWCGWCKVMDRNTFSVPEVAKILNEKFWPVKLDAEQRADIIFQGNTFRFKAYGNGGTHEFAAALLSNKLSYPTVVFLDEDFAMIQPLPGYQKAPEFHKIIQFIGEGHFRKMKWQEWQQKYRSPFASETGSGN